MYKRGKTVKSVVLFFSPHIDAVDEYVKKKWTCKYDKEKGSQVKYYTGQNYVYNTCLNLEDKTERAPQVIERCIKLDKCAKYTKCPSDSLMKENFFYVN
jgi:hypothetical protein